MQVFYTGYIIFTRPYEETKGNIIEILNEFYFTSLLATLIFLNKEVEWSSLKSDIYMWVLASNTMVIFLIVLTGIIIKASNDNQNVIRIIPKTIIKTSPYDNTHQEITNERNSNNLSILSSNSLPEESKFNFVRRNPRGMVEKTKDWS